LPRFLQTKFIFGITAVFILAVLNYDDLHAEGVIWLETEKLQLGFQNDNDLISTWNVCIGDAEDELKWHSIITDTDNCRAKSRHLTLSGIDFKQGGWEKFSNANALVFLGISGDDRLMVRKKLIADNAYRLLLRIEIENVSDDSVDLSDGVRLQVGPGLGEYPAEGFGIFEEMYSFVEPVVYSEGRVARIEMDDDTEGQVLPFSDIEWYGLHSRYFALLLHPLEDYSNERMRIGFRYQTQDDGGSIPDRYLPVLSIDLGVVQMDPSQIVQRDFHVFSGPKTTAALKGDSADFSGLLFSGLWNWMALLCLGLLWLLNTIYSVIPSWGLSIIVLAVLVRLAMYPLASRALSSQKEFADVQKKIQPEMRRIKAKYKGGQQSEKILQLYEHHGVSPLAGLKPLLIVIIQLPIFIALFHVLGQAFELMNAPFLWIDTLSAPDKAIHLGVILPYFGEYLNVLPVLMAAVTLLTIRAAPAPSSDKSSSMRQNIFLVLVAMGFFMLFYSFPAGMVLYWTMANVLHLLQQAVVKS